MSSKVSRGGKEKKEEEEAGKGGKRGGLTDVSCHLETLRRYRTFPWASREGRTGTQPYWNLSSLPRGGDQSPILSLSCGPSTKYLRPGPGD